MINPKRLAQKIVLIFSLFSILFTVSGFKSQTPPAYAAICGYSFPAIVRAGSSFNVSVSGTAGSSFQVGIVDSLNHPVGGGESGTMPATGPLSLTVTAPNPATGGPFRLLASDLTDPDPCIAPSQAIAITPADPAGTGGSAECDNFSDCTTIPGIPGPDPATFGDDTFIVDLVTQILPIAIGIGGFLSVIIVIVSGIQFITSNGNPEGAAAARGRLIFALVGFVLLTLAFAITKVIDSVFLLSGTV